MVSGAFDLAIPEPALAEYASSDAHSLCVICEALASQQGAIGCRSDLHRACLYLSDEEN